MSNLNHAGPGLTNWDTMIIDDDFVAEHSDTLWTDVLTDTGTLAIGDAVSGVATLTPGAGGSVDDNDECILHSTNELFKFLADRPIYGRCRFRYTAVVAADPNICFGFMNAAATDPLGDNGAGAKVSGSTLAMGKVDGETVWRVWSATNGTSTTTKSNKTIAAATDYDVEIFCDDFDGVTMLASFKVNGEYLKDEINGLPIRHRVTIASATEMNVFVAIKLGAATNNDTFLVDRIYAAQRRAPLA
jgi:hypothetical protein